MIWQQPKGILNSVGTMVIYGCKPDGNKSLSENRLNLKLLSKISSPTKPTLTDSINQFNEKITQKK